MKTIAVVGSRRRDSHADWELFVQTFDAIYHDGDRIVSGGCREGADHFAEVLARDRGLTIIIHHADWNGPDGLKAGFVRNTKIAQDCNVMIALPAPDRKGGTEDSIQKAKKLGKEVILV